jgi:hypothetical protein
MHTGVAYHQKLENSEKQGYTLHLECLKHSHTISAPEAYLSGALKLICLALSRTYVMLVKGPRPLKGGQQQGTGLPLVINNPTLTQLEVLGIPQLLPQHHSLRRHLRRQGENPTSLTDRAGIGVYFG